MTRRRAVAAHRRCGLADAVGGRAGLVHLCARHVLLDEIAPHDGHRAEGWAQQPTLPIPASERAVARASAPSIRLSVPAGMSEVTIVYEFDVALVSDDVHVAAVRIDEALPGLGPCGGARRVVSRSKIRSPFQT